MTQKNFQTKCCFIELETGKYKNKVVRTNRFSKRHTVVNIYNDLDETMKYFKLSGSFYFSHLN